MRDDLNIPHGERFELCRSVHAEANAIIAAARDEMLQGVMYIVCMDAKTGDIVSGVTSLRHVQKADYQRGHFPRCHAGQSDEYRVISVRDWIFKDESLAAAAEINKSGRALRARPLNDCKKDAGKKTGVLSL